MNNCGFKQILKEQNISIYQLSKKSDIPYTTLNELINGKKNIEECKIKTMQKIAEAMNISIEMLLTSLVDIKPIITLSTSWEDKKNYIYYFPVVVDNNNYDVKRIHPLMQKKVSQIYEKLKTNTDIKKIILFGSSTNIRCNSKSDLDLAILLKDDSFTKSKQNEVSEIIQDITEYNADIIWLNTIDLESQLYENIKRGVIIYE